MKPATSSHCVYRYYRSTIRVISFPKLFVARLGFVSSAGRIVLALVLSFASAANVLAVNRATFAIARGNNGGGGSVCARVSRQFCCASTLCTNSISRQWELIIAYGVWILKTLKWCCLSDGVVWEAVRARDSEKQRRARMGRKRERATETTKQCERATRRKASGSEL